jgi:hypothetical protein
VQVGVIGWIGIGVLRSGFWLEGRGPVRALVRPELPPTVLNAFVAAIGVLLAVFVGFQAGELFLSSQEFQATMGMTMSEYARSGFFELVWVATLALPLLHAADWCVSRRESATVVRFHRLTAAVMVLLFLILASACYRMVLYGSFYGLTELRFYTIAFMLWLAGVFGWFGATVLRGRRSRFVPGTLGGAFAVLLTLNVISPDALIARVNLERARDGVPLDRHYLTSLSADALPTVLRGAGGMSATDRCLAFAELQSRWGRDSKASREWNLSRRAAARALDGVRAPMPGCTVPETR